MMVVSGRSTIRVRLRASVVVPASGAAGSFAHAPARSRAVATIGRTKLKRLLVFAVFTLVSFVRVAVLLFSNRQTNDRRPADPGTYGPRIAGCIPAGDSAGE